MQGICVFLLSMCLWPGCISIGSTWLSTVNLVVHSGNNVRDWWVSSSQPLCSMLPSQGQIMWRSHPLQRVISRTHICKDGWPWPTFHMREQDTKTKQKILVSNSQNFQMPAPTTTGPAGQCCYMHQSRLWFGTLSEYSYCQSVAC